MDDCERVSSLLPKKKSKLVVWWLMSGKCVEFCVAVLSKFCLQKNPLAEERKAKLSRVLCLTQIFRRRDSQQSYFEVTDTVINTMKLSTTALLLALAPSLAEGTYRNEIKVG